MLMPEPKELTPRKQETQRKQYQAPQDPQDGRHSTLPVINNQHNRPTNRDQPQVIKPTEELQVPALPANPWRKMLNVQKQINWPLNAIISILQTINGRPFVFVYFIRLSNKSFNCFCSFGIQQEMILMAIFVIRNLCDRCFFVENKDIVNWKLFCCSSVLLRCLCTYVVCTEFQLFELKWVDYTYLEKAVSNHCDIQNKFWTANKYSTFWEIFRLKFTGTS